MKPLIRVVFDTNILFSSVGWKGTPYECVQAARRGECVSVTCVAILEELTEKLVLKRRMSEDEALEAVRQVKLFSKIASTEGVVKYIEADPDDDVVLECGMVGGANFIVSGDRHLLNVLEFREIEIVGAAAFLARLRTA